VKDKDGLDQLMKVVEESQHEYLKMNQEQVDKSFSAAALAATNQRVQLAQMTVEEGGMGILEDKTLKNHYSSEYTHNAYGSMKTVGVVEGDDSAGFYKVAEPVGILAGVVPCTNPTSTTIFKCLLALKTRNCIVFSPHPRTAKCTVEAARIVRDAAVAAGAPKDCIGWIDIPTVQLCSELMNHPSVQMIVATGAGGMVKAAYSSGKPAMGGGAGNTPVVIDEFADVPMVVNSVILSKTFDNGMICASEQAFVCVEAKAQEVKDELVKRGCYFLKNAEERKKVADLVINDKGGLNPAAVGQPAWRLAQLAGLENPPTGAPLLVGEINEIGPNEKLSGEKLCPCMGFFVEKDFNACLERGRALLEYGGMGHTSVYYTTPDDTPEKKRRVAKFGAMMPTGRTLVNMPTSQGALGDIFNFKQSVSMSLGCGSWGHNASSDGLQPKHVLNYKNIAHRRDHILWFKVPPAIYFNRGTLGEGCKDLKQAGIRKAFIVTDNAMKVLGYVKRLTNVLDEYSIDYDIFSDITPDPTDETVEEGVARMNICHPDCIIAFGGGSPMDAAKIMRLRYEHPEVPLEKLYSRFMDLRKRVVDFPKLGTKVKKVVCIPTTSGTGSEMTPFAVITSAKLKIKYPIVDYRLTPDMAIMDADFVLTMPKVLASMTGFDALTHAVEAYVSMFSTDYTRGLSMQAIRVIFNDLGKSVNESCPAARESVHNASSIAGMAFANAFLGVCHSMAHQLGAFFHIPHGVANALLICQVIKFNAEDAPTKMGTFPQYAYPKAKQEYAEIADAIGVTEGCSNLEEKVDRLVMILEELKVEVQLPVSIKAYGITEDAFMEKVDEMALCAFDDQCTGTNPRYPLVRELRQLMIDAFHGTIQYLPASAVPPLARKTSLLLKARRAVPVQSEVTPAPATA